MSREEDRRLLDAESGVVLVERLEVADDFFSRGIGLLGRRGLDDGCGLLLVGCNNIHMFFMRFAIDAVFLDSGMNVVRIVECLKPWRVAACRKAAHVLELPAGCAECVGFTVGRKVVIGGL